MDRQFGNVLRNWRKKRHLSQLDLGLDANVSARHISFLESGRSHPSRDMIRHLGDVLNISKPQINQAFIAAGFAPYFRDFSNDHGDLKPIHLAVDKLLENHMPFPAIAMDKYWNIKKANVSALNLLNRAGFSEYSNLIEAMISQPPSKSAIVNWHESVTLILIRLRTELFQLGIDEELQGLVGALEKHFEYYSDHSNAVDMTQAVIPTRMSLGEQTISVFSTIAQFGSVFDLHLSELKVELMFPTDADSEAYFKQLVR